MFMGRICASLYPACRPGHSLPTTRADHGSHPMRLSVWGNGSFLGSPLRLELSLGPYHPDFFKHHESYGDKVVCWVQVLFLDSTIDTCHHQSSKHHCRNRNKANDTRKSTLCFLNMAHHVIALENHSFLGQVDHHRSCIHGAFSMAMLTNCRVISIITRPQQLFRQASLHQCVSEVEGLTPV